MSSALGTLRRDFGGGIIDPGGAEYESASGSLLASGNPAHVLRPHSVGDVQAGVRFAARAGLLLSVRGGGHGFAGFGTNDGGVVIDLSKLANVEIIDSEHHLVRIGGGATWGQVAAALTPHGLAISSGDTKSVGVGGLTLTGGIGWKVRKYGLALDNVAAAEVVTADGEIVHASAEENPELFWAIRGGGGNFGIVTAFDFAAHPTTDVFYGKIAFAASEAATVIQGWADYLRTAPEELTSTAAFANPFGGGPDAPVEIRVAFDGDDPELAARAIDPIRRLGTVIDDDVALQPYADTLADGTPPPPGLQFAVRSAFADRESVPEVLRILAEVRASERSPFIAIRSVGGAVSRVPDDSTAYAHRHAELMVVTTSAGSKPVVDAARPALEAIWERLTPHVNGAYANFLSTATEEDVAAVYPTEVYNRLAAVKRQYDPGNLFARNHNVRPFLLRRRNPAYRRCVVDRDVDDALARSFLAGLPTELAGRLRAEGERADYPEGTTVYRAGDDPRAALVVRGLMRVYLSSPGGRQVTVRYARPGDVLGIAVLVGGPADTSVQAVEPSSSFRISARTLTEAARRDARVSWAIAEELNRRLYEVLEQTAVNAFGSVRQRVAAHLLDLASGRQRPGGRLAARVSQQELADAAGSVREVVARALRDLRAAGIVATAADSVVILDPARLYAESGGPAGL